MPDGLRDTPIREDRFAALDSLRGICAIIVVLFHFRISSHITQLSLIRNGWLFVDFFFVLSGFVIGHAYAARLQARRVSPGRFLFLRIGRIYPLHVAILAIMVGLELSRLAIDFSSITQRQPFVGPRGWEAVGTNLLMLHSFGVHPFLTWNGPSWSIAAELWTYVVFALVFTLCGSRALPIMAALGLTGLLAVAVFAPHQMNTTYQFGFLRCLGGFSFGLIVQWLFARGFRHGGTRNEGAALILAIGYVSFVGSGAATLAAPAVFAVAVWVFASDSGWFAKALQRPIFTTIGLISYSIYMVHALVQARIGDAIKLGGAPYGISLITTGGGVTEFPSEAITAPLWLGDILVIAMVIIVVVVSMLTYRVIERPCREWARRRVQPTQVLRT